MKITIRTVAAAGLIATAFAIPQVLAGTGEFEGKCTYGLSQKGDFATPCEVTWKSEGGKTYCFGNEEVKAKFLKDPKANLTKAEAHYMTLKKN